MDKFQEAALRQHLIDTVVNNDVIAPMEQAKWTQGTYQQNTTVGLPGGNAPDASNVPTQGNAYMGDNPPSRPLQGQSTQLNSLDFEQFREPNGLYAGKYKTPEELVKGMRNVVDMAKQAFAERDELRSRLAQPTTTEAPGVPSYSAPVSQDLNVAKNLDEVLNQIVEEGGLLDAHNTALLRDAIIKLTEDRAKNVVNAQDTEEQKWLDVSRRMEATYPGSSHRADELHLYVQTNPSVATAVNALLAQGQEYEATELAWRLMTNSSLGQSPALTPAQVKQEILTAQELVRQEAVDAARKDAGVITSAGGGVHEAPPTNPTRDDIMQAAAYGRTTADWSQWRRAALANHLDFDSPLFRT